ncbi:MAG: hypothetical protein IBJ08_00920 [Pseudomonas sp.]|nr:hypothetical protein [Pseudomonas sp.]
MNLSEFKRRICESEPEDWTVITCWGADSGPSFLDKLDVWTNGNGEFSGLEIDSHSNVMSFKPDLQISVAYGMQHNDDFREEWANSFPDPHASSAYVDFFYAKNLVYRDIYVAVDGGRFLLPLPEQKIDSSYTVTGLTVTRERAAFFALLNGNDSRSYYECLRRAGIEVSAGRWMV